MISKNPFPPTPTRVTVWNCEKCKMEWKMKD